MLVSSSAALSIVSQKQVECSTGLVYLQRGTNTQPHMCAHINSCSPVFPLKHRVRSMLLSNLHIDRIVVFNLKQKTHNTKQYYIFKGIK